ncbi:MAG: SPFH domain-containing protein [Candidatus Paceibacterota bacterium]|jgi:hypothetical protein
MFKDKVRDGIIKATEDIKVGSPLVVCIAVIAGTAIAGLGAFLLELWVLAFLFWGVAVITSAILQNGWVDTGGTNPPYMLARLHFGHYVMAEGKIRLEEELGKRFFFLYGFMSTVKLFDMGQHQTSITIKDVKTVSKDDAGKPVTQSTGNIVEVLYVYQIDHIRAREFVLAAGEIDGQKTEAKHFNAIENKMNSAISATLNQICGDPNDSTINGWDDLTKKREELAKVIAERLKGKGEGHFSVLEKNGIELVRIFIADVKPDPDLEERQEEIALAAKQAEVNQMQARAQAKRVNAYINGIKKFKKVGLPAPDAASFYAAINEDVPASTIFVRGGDPSNVAAAAIFSQGKTADDGGKKGGTR